MGRAIPVTQRCSNMLALKGIAALTPVARRAAGRGVS